jgi:hypothetical protein
MAHVVEHVLWKCEALNSNLNSPPLRKDLCPEIGKCLFNCNFSFPLESQEKISKST